MPCVRRYFRLGIPVVFLPCRLFAAAALVIVGVSSTLSGRAIANPVDTTVDSVVVTSDFQPEAISGPRSLPLLAHQVKVSSILGEDLSGQVVELPLADGNNNHESTKMFVDAESMKVDTMPPVIGSDHPLETTDRAEEQSSSAQFVLNQTAAATSVVTPEPSADKALKAPKELQPGALVELLPGTAILESYWAAVQQRQRSQEHQGLGSKYRSLFNSAQPAAKPAQSAPSPEQQDLPSGYAELLPGIFAPADFVTVRPSAEELSGPLAPGSGLQFGDGSEYPRYPLARVAPLTSQYGPRSGRLHAGVDIGVPVGTPVLASLSGTVVVAGWLDGYGNTVIIQQPGGKTETYYAHLSGFYVKTGQSVQQGQVIARSGNTGRSTGPHLHFEIRQRTSTGWAAININQIVAYAQAILQNPQPQVAQQPMPQSNQLEMRVLLATNANAFSLASTSHANLLDANGQVLGTLPQMQAIAIRYSSKGILIGKQLFPGSVLVQPMVGNGAIAINGKWYRGRVLLVAHPKVGLMAVNWVGLEDYLISVVGSESYPSWKPHALMAQAVAARSYAVTHHQRPASAWYDLDDSPRFQAYNGLSSEYPSTYQAVAWTQGVVLTTPKGHVIEAMYAATEAISNAAHGGFGLSQWGAAKMAANGHSYQTILSYYYPGSRLSLLADPAQSQVALR